MMLFLGSFLLACTGSTGGGGPPSEGDTDTDSDADTDTDTDSDADTDTDTDTDTVTTGPGWEWSTSVGVGAADASYVDEKTNPSMLAGWPGDIDGDGHADLVIFAPGDMGDASGEGAHLYVLYDGETERVMDMPVTELPSVAGTDGSDVSTPILLGDINDDGREDLAVAADDAYEARTVSLMYGADDLDSRSTDDPDAIVTLEEADGVWSTFYNLYPAGDVDGDGVDDVLFLSALRNGEAYVIPVPSLSGPSVSAPTDAVMWVHGHDGVSPSYRAPGDVTGDGFADVLGVDYSSKNVWVFNGGTGTLPFDAGVDDADALIECDPGQMLNAVVLLSDVDGDGVNDFSADVTGGSVDLGAHVFFGGPTIEGRMGPDDGKFTFARGESAYTGSNLGDIDGDGLADVSFYKEAGDAYDTFVVLGAGGWPSDVAADDADIHIPHADLRLVPSGQHDINGDGLHDLTISESTIGEWGSPTSLYLDVYVGRIAWPTALDTGAADVQFENEADHDTTGGAFAVLDLDVDGFDDVVVPRFESEVFGVYDSTLYIHFGQPGP